MRDQGGVTDGAVARPLLGAENVISNGVELDQEGGKVDKGGESSKKVPVDSVVREAELTTSLSAFLAQRTFFSKDEMISCIGGFARENGLEMLSNRSDPRIVGPLIHIDVEREGDSIGEPPCYAVEVHSDHLVALKAKADGSWGSVDELSPPTLAQLLKLAEYFREIHEAVRVGVAYSAEEIAILLDICGPLVDRKKQHDKIYATKRHEAEKQRQELSDRLEAKLAKVGHRFSTRNDFIDLIDGFATENNLDVRPTSYMAVQPIEQLPPSSHVVTIQDGTFAIAVCCNYLLNGFHLEIYSGNGNENWMMVPMTRR